MARKRMSETTFISWGEVDRALRRIGEIDRDIGLLEASANEAIDQIKAQTKEKVQPLVAQKKVLELAMKEFCENSREDFGKGKSMKLTFGTVSFRLSTSLVIKKVADTIAKLKELQLFEHIRVKEEINKETLKDLPAERLAELGVAVKTTDAFGYEVDTQQVDEAAA